MAHVRDFVDSAGSVALASAEDTGEACISASAAKSPFAAELAESSRDAQAQLAVVATDVW